MPRQTFLNLPESKRRAIVDVAIDEFAAHTYRDASISRIVARAGIAKGSIYQYFEDKRDLFMYLLDLAVQEKMAVLQQKPPRPDMDFFSYLRWMAEAGGKATLSNPRLARVAYRAYFGDLPFHDEVVSQMQEASLRYMEGLVRQAIARGDIAADVDPDMAVFVVNTLVTELGKFIFRRVGIDPAQVGRDGSVALAVRVVEEAVDQLVRVLERGLSNPSAHKEAWQ